MKRIGKKLRNLLWQKDGPQSPELDQKNQFLNFQVLERFKLQHELIEMEVNMNSSQVNRKCSLSDLLVANYDQVENTIFKIIQTEEDSKTHANSTDDIPSRYVQVKCSSFKSKTIIQIIDISNSIMFDQQRAQNEFLNVINACVSHELRNPLNSISAQNMLKKHLYA